MSDTLTEREAGCVEEILHRVAGDLSMIADREFRVIETSTERAHTRPAGEGKIHISFRLGFKGPSGVGHGCLVIPLPDAIALASCLMMVPEDTIRASRELTDLDSTIKDAMLEVGNFITGATDSAVRAMGADGMEVVFEGCQGVRADVRPAMVYEEGAPLLIGRAQTLLEGYEEDKVLLMLPELGFLAG